MTGKPMALARLDATVKHLRETLRKAKDIVPPSLTNQLCGLLTHWGRMLYQGHSEVHPGMAKMAGWGNCSERQARSNLRILECWGIVVPTSYLKGGRRATRFQMRPAALVQALILQGVNLHPTLIEKLRNPEVNPEVRAEEYPDATSAGILSDMGGDLWVDPEQCSARESEPGDTVPLDTRRLH